MTRQVSPSTSRAYGILRVTRLWGTSRATLYRYRRHRPGPRRRPGPIGPCPDEALVEAIRALLAASPFHGEGHRKVWARLRFAGIRTSKRRVLRLMREHGLLAPGRVGRPHGPRAHDGTVRTERVDAMWGTDLTSTMTGEGQASIFVTVDHCSTECLDLRHGRSLLDGMRRHPRRPSGDPLRGARAAAPGCACLLRCFRRGRRARPRAASLSTRR
ncbi:MAG: Integrase catalytic region [Geminicoccaceae bacterium]|nr:Integrase catalytic region [Geminicoccaceae bacterium]